MLLSLDSTSVITLRPQPACSSTSMQHESGTDSDQLPLPWTPSLLLLLLPRTLSSSCEERSATSQSVKFVVPQHSNCRVVTFGISVSHTTCNR